jgi:hypothetical protein
MEMRAAAAAQAANRDGAGQAEDGGGNGSNKIVGRKNNVSCNFFILKNLETNMPERKM